MLNEHSKALVRLALSEDLGTGDITSEATLAADAEFSAVLIARSDLVVCGHEVAAEVFSQVDSGIKYTIALIDGCCASDGQVLAELKGRGRAILAGERTALNFMQRLSGIASKTHRIVELVAGTGVRILDTRKTAPGFRALDKYAVAAGGGVNHRHGLYDAVLIKNNHVDAVNGDIGLAIRKCREYAPRGTKIQVEVRNKAEMLAALDAAPDAILLDNMSPEVLQQTVEICRAHSHGKRVELEASGGITESNIKAYACTGVDFISLGALTHSVQAADISLRYKK